jgi:formate/nitrite transporter FocA (FNT family)
VFRRHVPDGAWRPLVVSLGYPVGFLMVVLARQQLFTENTITAVLPVAAQFTARNLMLLARNWSVVFGANLVGALVAALFCSFTPVIAPELRDSMLAVSRHVMASGWWGMLCGGIAAGYLIAAMVWLIPSAESAQFLVIVVMTWLIAAGGFKHIVAGSVDAFMLVANGEMGIAHMITGFTIPVLIGNVIGGTALFALIAYAQIMKEV